MASLTEQLLGSTAAPPVVAETVAAPLTQMLLTAPSASSPAPGTGSMASDELAKAYPNIPRPGPATHTDRTFRVKAIEDKDRAFNALSDAVVSGYKSGVGSFVEGVEDFKKGQGVTGVGKMLMTPLHIASGPFTAAKDFAEGVVGKPNPVLPSNLLGGATSDKLYQHEGPGGRAFDIATSGLPIAKVGKVVSRNIPSNKALNDLVEVIGPQNLPEVIARLKSNDRLAVADVSMPVREMTQRLAVTEGQQIHVIDDFVKGRKAGERAAVQEAFDDAMGAPVNIVQKVRQLENKLKETGKTEIAPVLSQTGAVDITPVVAHIDQILKPGVQALMSPGSTLPLGKIEKELEQIKKLIVNEKETMFDAEKLHWMQSNLRARASDLMRSGGEDAQLGKALMNVRQKLVDVINDASPATADGVGAYKTSLSKYKDDIDVQTAFKRGQDVFKNRADVLDDRPEALAEWMMKKTTSKEEIQAAKEGARAAVDFEIRRARNPALKGETLGEVEFNADKMRLLFGKEKADDMLRTLKDERDIAKTNYDLFEGSQTAMRTKSHSKVDLPVQKPEGQGLGMLGFMGAEALSYLGGQTPGVGGFLYGSGALAKTYGRNKLHKTKVNHQMAINNEMANLTLATGPSRDALIKALEARIPSSQPNTNSVLYLGNKLRGAISPP